MQTFKPNPYFEDQKLSKTFKFTEDGLVTVSGSKPRWKDGMVREEPPAIIEPQP